MKWFGSRIVSEYGRIKSTWKHNLVKCLFEKEKNAQIYPVQFKYSFPSAAYMRQSTSSALIGSDNGLLPLQRLSITWTNAGILSIELLGTNFNEIRIGILSFSFKRTHLKLQSATRASILPRGRWVTLDGINNCDCYSTDELKKLHKMTGYQDSSPRMAARWHAPWPNDTSITFLLSQRQESHQLIKFVAILI